MSWEKKLFPGFFPIILSLIGLVSVKVRNDSKHTKTAYPLFFLFSMLFFFIFSLGSSEINWNSFKFPNLYLIFFQWFPGVSGMRVPARAGIMVMLSLAVFSGLGISAIRSYTQRFSSNRLLSNVVGLMIFFIIGAGFGN